MRKTEDSRGSFPAKTKRKQQASDTIRTAASTALISMSPQPKRSTQRQVANRAAQHHHTSSVSPQPASHTAFPPPWKTSAPRSVRDWTTECPLRAPHCLPFCSGTPALFHTQGRTARIGCSAPPSMTSRTGSIRMSVIFASASFATAVSQHAPHGPPIAWHTTRVPSGETYASGLEVLSESCPCRSRLYHRGCEVISL